MIEPIAPRSHFLHGVFPAIILTTTLIAGLVCTVEWLRAGSESQSFLGVTTQSWLWILMANILVHQFSVWLVWRAQLCFGLFSRLFKKADLVVWGMVFLPLLAARPLLSLFIGLSDFGTLPGPRLLHLTLGILLLLLAAAAGHSVIKHFGVVRAMGADHFRVEYRSMPMVHRGMYRITNNVMYSYIFLLFWAIGFLTSSSVALIAGLFQHALIWVHYYTVEKPDMEVLYEN